MDEILKAIGIIAIIFFLVLGFFKLESSYNKEIHNEEDVIVTEWISPDGVHYWYQEFGYHAMLAPRYDNDGNLVIDEE